MMSESLTVTVDDGGTYTVDVRGVALFTDQGLTSPASFPASVSAQTTWYAAAPSAHGRRPNIEVVVTASDGTRVQVDTFNSLPATVNLTEGSVDLSGPSSSGGSSAVAPPQVVQAICNTDGTIGDVRVYDTDGTLHPAAFGSLPEWVIAVEGAGLYVNSTKRITLLVRAASDVSGGSYKVGATNGWGLIAGDVPADETRFDMGEILGTPGAWESGGPASEPGFDQVEINITGLTLCYLFLSLA